MFCKDHRPRALGDAVQGGGAKCSNCELITYAAFAYCDACSIQLGRCQKCKTAISTYASPMMHIKISYWRWQMRRAIDSIEAEYQRIAAANADDAGAKELDEKAKRAKEVKIRQAQQRFERTVERAQALLVAKQAIALARREDADKR